MKTPRLSLPPDGWPIRLACLSLTLAPLAPALAVDGTITIDGEITEQTCKINNVTPPADMLVNLPKISTTALKNKGDVAGATLFEIKLTDCPEALSGNVKAYFEPSATVDLTTGNLHAYTNGDSAATIQTKLPDVSSKSKASNVQIQLANADGSTISIGNTDSGAQGVPLTAGTDSKKTATLRYLARYIKTESAAVSAGRIVAYVQYSIQYP